MKAKMRIETEIDLKTMHVSAKVNGQTDDDGQLIPCRRYGLWEPVIDIETGIIINWEKGKKASVNYKVCDCCSYYFLDADGGKRLIQDGDYVPALLCPAEDGDGDYIIMEIDENGKIQDWDLQELRHLIETAE